MKSFTAFGVASTLISSSCAASNSSTSAALLSSGNVQLGDFSAAYQKAKTFVSGLTNAQKTSIITGGDVSGSNVTWTALQNKDGSSGINYQYYVSGFSMSNALAMTWDRDYYEKQAKAAGLEFYLMGYNLINGPECGPLGRIPWGGRQAEAFSPDPYLSGAIMSKMIPGMNSAGVVAAGRHFLLNEQETNRTTGTSDTTSAVYSSNADDKTIHELYLWPFQDGVKAGMAAVMCAMNRVNGTLSCENDEILSGLLKEELGFPGMVFPDVNSQSTAYGSANAGLDYGSSSYWTADVLEAGMANGSFTQARLDDMAVRNVIGYYFVGLDDGRQPAVAATTEYRDVRKNHAALIRDVGAASLVLLKNDNSALPLDRPRTISVFGAHAGPAMAGPNQAFTVQGTDSPVYQGHLASGSGSGALSFSYLVTPFQSLTARAAADGSMIRWILNDTYSDSSSSGGMSGGGGMGGDGGPPGMSGNSSSNGTAGGDAGGGGGGGGGGGIDLSNLGQGTAVTPSYGNYASDSEACLVFLNSYAGEGADRTELTNADQDTLVTTVAGSCNNTIVVVNTVGPRLVDAWINHANVTAVLYGGLLGQESGNAIADVLYGDVNPSGKLIHTLAKNESDYPASICLNEACPFTEGVHVDYRHFDRYNVTPRYPFGHGLSYTTFAFASNLTADLTGNLTSVYPTAPLAVGGKPDLFDDVITVSTTVTNTGEVAGAEVAQLYVAYPAEAEQPVRQLRGFEKVALAPGESREVVFRVRRKDVSFWDTAAGEWAVARGTYTFWVGASSRDLRAEVELVV